MLFNPLSGGARRDAEVERLGSALRADGHDVVVVRVGDGSGPGLRDALRGSAALVIVGGDGTLHHAIADASRAGVPVYHWPAGTENLFARHFGMKASETALRRALASGETRSIDYGDADGRPFALMCSVGPDAAVAHRLHRERTGSISRLTYLQHVLRELREKPPRLRVWVDGQLAVDGIRGMCIVANCREYGARFDPAPLACVDDGVLDVVFMPAETSVGVLGWLLKARTGRHRRDGRLVHRTGREVVIANAGEAPAWVQCDGEATGSLAPGTGGESAVQIVVRERGLNVLG